MGLSPDDFAQRGSGLSKCEVERGALERPAAVVDVDEPLGQRVEQRLCREVLGERVNRPVAGERERRSALLLAVVLGSVVRHVLADAFLACSVEVDDRRLAQELRPRLQLQALERVAVDLQREIADGVVQAHSAANATATSPASRALAAASLRFTSCVRPPERSCRRASTNGVTA